ncbi:hypothetical protein ANAPC5_01289 [Anaplasma phagocytophilum]|nr:hypothetical protein ANAPC5_01289 [Anaplasma phagocytophilum]
MNFKQNIFFDRPPKRGHADALLIETASYISSKFPKFLVMHSEGDKPLGKLSTFLVSKVLEGVRGKNYNAKKMSSGDLLVEIHTKQLIQSQHLTA